jgi:hypothetical protein
LGIKKTSVLFLKSVAGLEKRITFAAAYRGKHFTKRTEIKSLIKTGYTIEMTLEETNHCEVANFFIVSYEFINYNYQASIFENT